MHFIDSIILGVVEGLTEFLPVSSTAHILLVSDLLMIAQTDFVKTFSIAIQSGAILAVIFLYWRSFLNINILKRLAVAFIPTAIIGFVLYKLIKGYLMENIWIMLLALFLGGIVLYFYKGKKVESVAVSNNNSEVLTYKQSFWLGTIQSIAIIPGVSRSGATIIGGLLMGIEKAVIVEFSFLLAVPTILSATAYDVYKGGLVFSKSEVGLLIAGTVVSFIVAILSIKLLLHIVRKWDFRVFGFYRIAISLVLTLYFFHI